MLTRFIILIAMTLMSTVVLAQQNKAVIELHHWWKTAPEQAAVNEIKVAAQNQNAIFEQYALESFDSHRTTVLERVGFGYLPAVTQWLAGEDLQAINQQGLLRKLPRIVDDQDLRTILYPEVLKEISNGDEILALPVGLHIQNVAFYNAKIYNELKLLPPLNWQVFLQQAKVIKEAGYTPIALSEDSWQLSFLVDSFLVDKGGAEAINAIRHGKGDLKQWRKTLIELFEFLKEIKLYVNPLWKDLSWNENTKLVANGQAAVQVMGDFAEAVMVFHEYSPVDDYFYELAPGNNDTIIYGTDVFALLKVEDDERIAGQNILVSTVLDPNVQKSYVSKKGGIPVRKDVDISDLSSNRLKLFGKWLNKEVEKIKLPESNRSFHYKVLETLTLDFWKNPDKNTPENMADKFIRFVDRVNFE